MGRPKLCNPCCDGGFGGSSSSSSSSRRQISQGAPCTTRCADSVTAAQYTATVSGVGANVCLSGFCTSLNRTWTMSQTAACRWEEVLNTGTACLGGATVRLAFLILGDRLRLQLEHDVGSVVFVLWDKLGTPPFDCLSSHTLTHVSTGTRCSYGGASITVAPA